MIFRSGKVLIFSLAALCMVFLLSSCEHLPWDKKKDDKEKKEEETKLFTEIAPHKPKVDSMDNERVDVSQRSALKVNNALKQAFPPSKINAPKKPPHLKPFYEKFIGKDATKYPVNFQWDSESIHTIVPAFSSVLNFNYTIDPEVKGAVTIKVQNADGSDIMMTKREIWNLFDQVLLMAGAYASLEGNIVHINPYSKMPREHRIYSDKPPMANVAVRLIRIKNLPAGTIVAEVKDFLSEGAKISEVTGENTILIVEDPENIDKITALIEQLDIKERQQWPRAIIKCTNFSCDRIKDELVKLLPVLGFNVTVDEMKPTPGSIHLGSITRLQVIVASAANKEAIDIVRKWVNLMDRSDIGEQESVYVYKVVSSSAEELLPALATIFNVEGTIMTPGKAAKRKRTSKYWSGENSPQSTQGSTRSALKSPNFKKVKTSSSSKQAPATIFEVPIKIFADGSHNRLLIRTTPRTYAMVKALLARIDTMPEQVLMQIMIAEATINKSSEYGLEFSAQMLNNSKYASYIGTQFPGLKPAKPANATDAGLQYLLQSKENDDKFAYIRALAGNGNTKILSSPQILVKSGTQASIDVGKDIPVITRTQTDTTNTNVITNNVEYRKVGVLLNLTPVVTEGGLISLDIDQEVSQQGPNVLAGGTTYPSFLERHVVTNLAIRNGGTIIMGGIIDEITRDNNDSMPFIAEIPLLANLLGYTTKQKDRIELLMMLTGTIVNEKTDLQKIIQRYNKAVSMFKEMKKQNEGKKSK